MQLQTWTDADRNAFLATLDAGAAETTLDAVDTSRFGPKGLRVRFFRKPVYSAFRTQGGTTVFTLQGRDDAERLAQAQDIVKKWDCGAELVRVVGPVPNKPRGAYEVEIRGAGRPVAEELDYVEISSGDPTTTIIRPVQNGESLGAMADRLRFPEQWARYRNGQAAETVEGFLLENWPIIRPKELWECKQAGYATVEQLAEAPDGFVSGRMELTALRAKAQDAVRVVKDGAALSRKATEVDELKRRLGAMEAMLEGLTRPPAAQPEAKPETKPEVKK